MKDKTAQTDSETKTENSKDTTPATRLHINWVWVALVVLLLINAVWFWLWQQQNKHRTEMQSELQQVQQSLAQNADLQSQIQQQSSKLTDLQDSDKQLTQKITDLESQQSLSSADIKNQWALAEVAYLLNIANQRAALAHDVQGAEKALTMADAKLEQVGDYRLKPLREKISDEKLALASVAKVDVTGIEANLQSAIKQVDSLRVVSGPEVKSQTKSDVNSNSVVPASWQQAIDGVWQKLRSLVVIRHKQDGSAAVLVPEQRYFLYQNLTLKLESARMALLLGNTNVYNDSLQSAIDWLQQYFVGDERDAMLSSLRELQNKDIKLTIPDISASLRWLKGFKP